MTPPPPQQKPSLPRRTPRDSSTARSTAADLPRSGPAGTAKVQEAAEARDTLAAALSAAGIQLPAMDIRTPWLETNSGTGDGGDGRPPRYALVHLGVCSAPVALALAAVIRNGAAR
ncbi:hypothetical protein OG497_09390 [Streptomyces sp. NBC_01242]|uniref:hypothetical protein n=1 Tax=unclassified Streptomyces TaxID=2593676 RepID=UPI0022596413|nr:hypothetical protein [Streptomyces sp. NBC_01242]MCX4794330.1 hypothetical protein [Streptomyces sp. NBC_01242]WSU21229.1 hypothetical protein OG508_09705 [Streptomyces sp. NBC_01108]